MFIYLFIKSSEDSRLMAAVAPIKTIIPPHAIKWFKVQGTDEPTARELDIARRAFFCGAMFEQQNPDRHFIIENPPGYPYRMEAGNSQAQTPSLRTMLKDIATEVRRRMLP